MKSPLLLFACLWVPILSGCTQESWGKAFAAKVVTVSFDDLGTAAAVSPVLGPRGTDPEIVVHHGATDKHGSPRRLNVYQGLLMLRRNARHLPHTAENEPLRQRMSAAYRRMYQHYRTRRDAMLAMPPSVGRGALGRMHMMPPVPPTL